MIADGVWESDDLDKESSFTPPSSPEGAGTPGTIEQGENVEDSNSFLPELTLTLIDPEGSRFDELLYWVGWCLLFQDFISLSLLHPA